MYTMKYQGWLYQMHFSAMKHLKAEYKTFFTKDI